MLRAMKLPLANRRLLCEGVRIPAGAPTIYCSAFIVFTLLIKLNSADELSSNAVGRGYSMIAVERAAGESATGLQRRRTARCTAESDGDRGRSTGRERADVLWQRCAADAAEFGGGQHHVVSRGCPAVGDSNGGNGVAVAAREHRGNAEPW